MSVIRRFVVLVLLMPFAPARAFGQTNPATAPAEAYRWSTGFSLLVPVDPMEERIPTGRVPSLRFTHSYLATPGFGLHIGGLRLAPKDAGLWAGLAGFRLNLTRGEIRLAPFVEGGFGVFQAVVDSGGFYTAGTYHPYRRPISGSAFGGGGGLSAEVIFGPGITLELLGGYWKFVNQEGFDLGQAFFGAGLRIAGKDATWYWRTSGRDRAGPTIRVAQPQPRPDGVVAVGHGQIALTASDVSEVADIQINGRSYTMHPRPDAGPGGQFVVATARQLGLVPGRNSLRVTAMDGAGNRTEQEVVVMGPPPDAEPPQIAVLTPGADAEVQQAQIRVTGTLVDETRIASVMVNGQAAQVFDAIASEAAQVPHRSWENVYVFEADVAIGAGPGELQISAVDTAGNEGLASHPVMRPDRDSPAISVTEPVEGVAVPLSRTRVSGWVVDEGQIAAVTVNGVPGRLISISSLEETAQSNPNLKPPSTRPGETAVRFEADVELAVGINQLEIQAVDAYGHTGTAEKRVVRMTTVAAAEPAPSAPTTEEGPRIRIEEPREWAGSGARGLMASQRSSVRVRGTVVDPMGGAIREVLINGYQAATRDAGGYIAFTGFVPIEAGTHEVEVVARTVDGRSNYELFQVQPQPARSVDATVALNGDGFRGQRFAVVIGISQYMDPNIPDLQYADDDARAFYEFLRSPAAGAGGIPEKNIELLVDDSATYRNMRSALRTFLQQATDQDIVYVYIAAHGAPSQGRPDDLYLLPYDTEWDDVSGTAYPMDDINEEIRKLYAHHTVLLTDACHSGGVGNGALGTRSAFGGGSMNAINQAFLMDLGSTRAGLAILTASESRQLSQEGEQWGGGHGVFTYYLLQGLNGAADEDGDRIVRWGELTEYVRSGVARATSNAQLPSIGSQTHDRFLPMAIVLGAGGR